MKYKKIIQFPLILFILLIICTGLFLITPKTIYAATEFTSIIDPDNGTGTDYTSLNAWEAANQVDLTATSTLVFSHSGITGTIPDGSTVTGATSGIKGEVTHATSTQVLIQNIRTSLTGTLTFTNGSTAVSGTGTLFTTELAVGDYIWLDADSTWAEVSSITDDSNLVLSVAYTGTGGTGTGAVRKGNFTSGEQVYETLDTNYVTISDAGDSAIAVASCRSSNGTADTTAVTIDGWTTGSTNYIKIWTDPSLGNRHNGKWDERKYRLEVVTTDGSVIAVHSSNVNIDGLQIRSTSVSGYNSNGIMVRDNAKKIVISNNIIRYSGNNNVLYCGITAANYIDNLQIYNNILYGFLIGIRTWVVDGNDYGYIYIYNNTIYNSLSEGMYADWHTHTYVKNNIAYNNTTDYSGTFDASSDYNISSDDTAPGANSKINQTVNFISTTSGIEDFHLASYDTSARDAGTDLSADSNLPFNTDIDGTTRTGSWDIGADEGSVEFTPTVMESGGDYSSLSAWEAGVQTDLTASTTRVFSHGGITGTIADDATVTGVTSGATATVVHATNTQILLENISGTFQSGEQVQVDASNYVTISDNGNPAIAVAKIDGTWTNPDTTPVTIDGWTTDHDNYIKIYTTSTARHRGKWDDTKYRLEVSCVNNCAVIRSYELNTRIDGLQIGIAGTLSGYPQGIYFANNGNVGYSQSVISNSIVKQNTSTGGSISGINISGDVTVFVYNNILYGFKQGTGNAISSAYSLGSLAYVYNNTIYDSDYGITLGTSHGDIIAKNNLISGTTNPFYGTFATGTDYNATDVDDTPGVGTHNIANAIINFISTTSGSEDFHLASYDTSAKDAGTNLSTDSYLPFSTDIDGNSRPIGSGWDIGADEYNATESVKIRGNVKLRGHFKFR